MKKIENLGRKLTKLEQKSIKGGDASLDNIVCCCSLYGEETMDCVVCSNHGQPNDCVNCANTAYNYCSSRGYTGTRCGVC